MLRLETNDLSKAEWIIRHPLIADSAQVPIGPITLTGPDRCTILIMDDEEPVGYIGFWLKGKSADIGTAVLPRYRGKELIPLYQAVLTTIYMLGAERIYCRVPPENIGAIKGARLLGFDYANSTAREVILVLPKQKWFQLHPNVRH